MIKIGVITPTFNRPDLLLKLHESLRDSAEDVCWVHCVVDDGSTKSYEVVYSKCNDMTGLLKHARIPNSGPLIARNHAIDMAVTENCTHLCFVDDDDILINQGLQKIKYRLEEFNGDWFIFGSKKAKQARTDWPNKPARISWFNDVVLGSHFHGDNLIVVTSSLVGDSRFCLRGRNQREWKFLMGLSKKVDEALIMPDIIMQKNYNFGGLTDDANNSKVSSPCQIYNNIDRSFTYWSRRPGSIKLLINLLKQSVFSLPKLLRYFFIRIFSRKNL